MLVVLAIAIVLFVVLVLLEALLFFFVILRIVVVMLDLPSSAVSATVTYSQARAVLKRELLEALSTVCALHGCKHAYGQAPYSVSARTVTV